MILKAAKAIKSIEELKSISISADLTVTQRMVMKQLIRARIELNKELKDKIPEADFYYSIKHSKIVKIKKQKARIESNDINKIKLNIEQMIRNETEIYSSTTIVDKEDKTLLKSSKNKTIPYDYDQQRLTINKSRLIGENTIKNESQILEDDVLNFLNRRKILEIVNKIIDDKMTERIATSESKLNTLKTKVEIIKTKVEIVETAMNEMNTQVDHINENVERLPLAFDTSLAQNNSMNNQNIINHLIGHLTNNNATNKL